MATANLSCLRVSISGEDGICVLGETAWKSVLKETCRAELNQEVSWVKGSWQERMC